jgi:hypothetical protein
MRKAIWLAAVAAIAAFPPAGYCQQDANSSQQSAGSQRAAQASQQAAPSQQQSLADAARRAREQKKDTPKQAKVFDNDNIPKQGGISAVGEEPPAPTGDAAAADANAPADATKSDKNAASEEKQWRDRFAKLNHKLQQDEADLEVMQRELGVLDLQYYNDPVKAMQQNLTRSDINEKTAKIAAKQKQIDDDKQAISDAQDDLRKAGGDPGWGR